MAAAEAPGTPGALAAIKPVRVVKMTYGELCAVILSIAIAGVLFAEVIIGLLTN